MQFHLRTLFVVTFAVALLCGVVFAAPPIVCLPVLCAMLWIGPAIWINGIIYGRGAWRPFFIGGVIVGLGPHLGALYYSYMLVVSLFSDVGELSDWFGSEARVANMITAAILLGPGALAFLGGLTGVATYWLLLPPKNERSPKPLAADEYLVVSGRLTTAPVERSVQRVV
ncbi:MAG TPA: hypothetical protein VFV87_00540 [Pirellulaceae bacterium]|nr:hypothetical protein [Pirellulaceae bacterium]